MEKIWLTSYPATVPAEVDVDAIDTLARLCERACATYAEKTAYIAMGRSLSYRELDAASRAFAGWLQAQGLGKGARVAVMLPNVLQYPVVLFGALRAGCCVVNCNPLYTPRELNYQLADSGAEVVVVLENFAHVVERSLAGTAVRRVIVTSLGEMLGTLRGALTDFVVRRVRKLVPPWRIDGALRLRAILAAGARHAFVPPALTPDDLAFLQYTGGTTGVAKGAMLSHRNVCANVAQAHAWIRPVLRAGEECVLTALPLYHIFALTANCLVFLHLGARNLLIANPRDIAGLVREWRRYPVSAVTGVNTLFNVLLNHPAFGGLDFSTLRVTLGGGMAVQATVAERWRQVTGTPLIQAYGLTEAAPAVTINPLDVQEFNGSIGLPLPNTEISIRDDAGDELPPGQPGEICVRGPQVMRSYWQRPEETAQTFHADGFLRTGDVGTIDADGYVYLLDRKKDLIVVSGFKVYPNEVEAVLAQHPMVREAAAVGVPDAHSGEAVKLFVVRRDAALTEQALIEYCRGELTAYKVPRQVEFRDDLPKSAIGKVLRRALKES